ncbi:MAG: hypothetical protein Q4F97_12520 [Bacteroidales bacterium]|nr:hypothetical protein [Bacteroidales bacterium]
MKNIFTLTLSLFLFIHLYSQSSDTVFIGTTDRVYFENDYEKHFINRSFLSEFKGFKDWFPDISKTKEMDFFAFDVPPVFLQYIPVWIVEDSVIYLVGIEYFLENERISIEKRIMSIEKYTGFEFCIKEFKNFAIEELPEYKSISNTKALKASWVNGVFYTKRARRAGEPYMNWKEKGFDKLTIKNGKIISIEKT